MKISMKILFSRVFCGISLGALWRGKSVTVKKQEEKIIASFHWPKLKYNFIRKNIIELDYFIRNKIIYKIYYKIHILRLTKAYIFKLHVYL